ncbi:hypothetical protein [Mycolicibacterium peregrinum]|uniref:hypothetical protein n=1 Tax=Mycobacteriaceae TaxID=1762 RepID=UPI003AAD6572
MDKGDGDIQLCPGLYTASLIGPQDWPTDSESEMARAAEELKEQSTRYAAAAHDTRRLMDRAVLDSWTGQAAVPNDEAGLCRQYEGLLRAAEAYEAGATGYRRLSKDVSRTKRLMQEAHDNAHREIAAAVETHVGAEIELAAPILVNYRALIEGYAAELRHLVENELHWLKQRFEQP